MNKENFIKDQKSELRKNRVKSLCITIMLFIISYIPLMYFMAMKSELVPIVSNAILFIIWVALSGIAGYYAFILEAQYSKKVTDFINNLFDFKNTYSKIEFTENDDIKKIESDFSNILLSNHNIRKKYYERKLFKDKIEKYNINDRIVYIGTKDTKYTGFFNVSAYSVYYLDIFTNINLNESFNIISISEDNVSKKNITNFEKRFEVIKKAKLENGTDLELDDDIKEKLVNLLNEYKIAFSVSIKDKLLVIEIRCFDFDLLKKPQKAKDIENLVSRLLDIFIKIEN